MHHAINKNAQRTGSAAAARWRGRRGGRTAAGDMHVAHVAN
eukprot:COSAG01_NODE_66895_length_268_cov_1.526627_1_plen_40_part_10